MTTTALHKAKWRARRGMRELDVLLNRFIDAHYLALTEDAQRDFDSLLEESDVDLYRWLTGRGAPSEETFVVLVERIRSCEN